VGTLFENEQRAEIYRWTLSGGIASLGAIDGGLRPMAIRAVSSDGAVIAANMTLPGFHTEAMRWTAASGWAHLGMIPGHNESDAVAMSRDGSVVVGWSGIPGRRTIVTWPAGSDIRSLDKLAGFDSCEPLAATADAKVIAGECTHGAVKQIFRFTEATGLSSIGVPAGSITYEFGCMSADGAVIVGDYIGKVNGIRQAFRWTAAGGAESLGFISGYATSSMTRDVCRTNADGSVVTGKASDANGLGPAIRWTQASGLVNLGFLPGHNDSHVSEVSADGSIVTGRSGLADPGTYPRVAAAVVWDASGKIRPISADLEAGGVDLAGFVLHDAWNVVSDGKVAYLGAGLASGAVRGWVAWLP
jgi:uncharacterized membrane protein